MIAEIVTLVSEEDAASESLKGVEKTARERMEDLLRQSGVRVLSTRKLVTGDLVIEQVLSESVALFDLVVVLDATSEGDEINLRKILAQVSGSRLVIMEKFLEDLKGFYRDQEMPLPRDIERQALLPKDTRWIPPWTGVRPALMIKIKEKHLLVLPDDLQEVERMWEHTLSTWFGNLSGRSVHIRTLKLRFVGRSPARIRSTFLQAVNGARFTFDSEGCLCNTTISMEGDNPDRVVRELERIRARVVGDLKQEFFGEDDETLEGVVGRLLIEQSQSIAIAESCTGGLITTMLVEIPGISSVLDRGVVTYSNTAKTDLLGVSKSVIKTQGAVSRVTARTMAMGIRKRAGTDIGLAVTGIAGPSGGTPEKPVGTVFIGLATPEGNEVTEYHFKGDRKAVRVMSAQMALDRVRRYLLGL